MKKLFVIPLIALVTVAALAGCGIPQDDYDKAMKDLTTAQTQIQKLENDLATAQNKINQLESENADLQSKLENAQTAYDTLQTEYNDLNNLVEDTVAKIETASVYKQIIVELIAPAITGEALATPDTINRVKSLVDPIDDETLREKFTTWENTPANRTLAADLLVYAILKLEEILF